jgi:hypothetical protein
MTVSVLGDGTEPSARPARKFDLDGTDRVLGRIKDDLLYEGNVNAESIEAACADFPALAEDLREWFADWTPLPTDEEVEAIIVSEDEVEATKERMLGYMKGLMRGMDSAKEQHAIKKDTK